MAGDIGVQINGADEIIQDFQQHANEGEDTVVYAVGSPLEYSLYQEVGTSFHPPQPYLRPATNSMVRGIGTILTEGRPLEDIIENQAEEVLFGSKKRAPVLTGDLKKSLDMERLR